jgi:hypothetical protein
MATHVLKADPDSFEEVYAGRKTFEIRIDDRKYAVGDALFLRETKYSGAEMCLNHAKLLEYTGREIARTVSHVMRGPIFGLHAGWVIMSLTVGRQDRRIELAEKKSRGELADAELTEFECLQAEYFDRLDRELPQSTLDTDRLSAIEARLAPGKDGE